MMAKLTTLPHQEIIDGFKGKIDFYVHRGIPCARRWPRSPGHRRAPAVEEQWFSFTYATQSWNSLTPEIQQAYRDLSADTNMSGRDLYMKSFLGTFFREGQWD